MVPYRGVLMRSTTQRYLLLLAKALPYIFLLSVGGALTITIALGQFDLAGRGLYMVLPAVLVLIISTRTSLIKKNSDTVSARIHLNLHSFTYVVLAFILLYPISLCILISNESRPFSYFCLISIMVGLIFVGILSVEQKHNGRRGIVLIQIAFLSLNLIFGQTLKLPLYFGATDIFSHMLFVRLIVENGHITPIMGLYQYFPLFHIFDTIGMLLTGMPLKASYFVFNGLAFIISIPIVYLLVSQLTKDARLPLVAVLLYSQSHHVIFNGMYMITRVMAYVLCLLALYLLIRGESKQWLRILAVFLIFPLVLTHQITLVYVFVILALLILIQLALYHRAHYISYTYLCLFVVSFLCYWSYIALTFFETMIGRMIVSESVKIFV